MGIRKAVKNPPRPPKSLLEFVWMMIKQMPMNLLRQIPWMILVSGFTWVFHTYVLVVINQGFDVSGASPWIKGILNAKSSPSGILFWTLMGGVASLGFGQLKQYGLSKSVTSIGTTPGWIAGSLKGFSLARLPLLFGSLAAGLLGLALVNWDCCWAVSGWRKAEASWGLLCLWVGQICSVCSSEVRLQRLLAEAGWFLSWVG
jgi:hypothetical protein